MKDGRKNSKGKRRSWRGVKELEMRMEEMQKGGGVTGGKGEEKGRIGGLERRMMEGMMEKRERENRRRNIVIRGLEIKEGKRKEEIEMVLEKMGIKAEIEEIRRLGGNGGGGKGGIVVVRLAKEE